jgi:hypothetical protein
VAKSKDKTLKKESDNLKDLQVGFSELLACLLTKYKKKKKKKT